MMQMIEDYLVIVRTDLYDFDVEGEMWWREDEVQLGIELEVRRGRDCSKSPLIYHNLRRKGWEIIDSREK